MKNAENFALVGYFPDKPPKIMYFDSAPLMEDRVALWRDGYRVDCLPIKTAMEIDKAYNVNHPGLNAEGSRAN